ncbi:unnamed protein product [Rotaria sp. Silwood1]|nr:unnamed protein product [Rotaria sp. Silwood1]CAF4669098.1 unnamed protein product [Rotaria sp. Silwood1]
MGKGDMDVSDDEINGDSSTDNEGEYDDNEEVDDESHQQDDDEQSEDEMLLETSYQEEQAMEQLSAVFKLLKINPVHDKLNTRSIRSKIDEVYTYLHGLCDILEGKSAQANNPNPHGLLVQESNDLLTGLKDLFNESDVSEQIRLLTIAPKEWGHEKVRKWFGSTQHQARQSLILWQNEGVLAFPQYFKGNTSISNDTITSIINFYREDGVSRVSSNSKDTIQINHNTVPIRYMEMSVLDAFRIFDERFPGLVGRTTFYSSRPRDAWNNYCQRIQNKSSSMKLNIFDIKDLINEMVCYDDKEDCFIGECQQCSTKSLINILTRTINVDLDENCSWTIWQKLNNKFDLQQSTGSVEAFLAQIEAQWSSFILHTFCNRSQREYIAELRTQSTKTTFVVAQIDFSMNYTLIRQREVQQGFFSQQQASLFTTHLTIGKEHRDIAIISDSMEHNMPFVYCAQRIIVDYVTKNFPSIKKIVYIR